MTATRSSWRRSVSPLLSATCAILPTMYSTSAAAAAGRRVGREIQNAWATEDELWQAVCREIGPQIRPRNRSLQRQAADSRNTALGVTGLALVALFACAGYPFVSTAEWMPHLFHDIPLDYVMLAALLTVAVLGFTWLAALIDGVRARKQQRQLSQQLLAVAFREAVIAAQKRQQREAHTGPARPTSATSPWALTPRKAEELAALWMRAMGATNVQVTRFQGDGGIDVKSSKYIAQVKRFNSNVGVAPIRELAGVVRVDGRRGLFFTTTGYAQGAIEFANHAGIALFTMGYENGELTAVNGIAQAFKQHGLQA